VEREQNVENTVKLLGLALAIVAWVPFVGLATLIVHFVKALAGVAP
jgi:hypothetical protein